MSTAQIVQYDSGARPVAEVKARIQRIQEVMRSVMKEKTHYGTIPGCDKPSLWKPGAEVLFSTFRIAVRQEVDDLSTTDEIRYRVNASASDAGSGCFLGAAYGECSSSEAKYRWRGVICDEEWDATPEDRRRVKWGKYNNKVYSTRQIRTEPADVANTILKMASKRAEVALCLRVTAASDIFTQDLEDLPEGMDVGNGDGEPKAPKPQMPRRASEKTAPAAEKLAEEVILIGDIEEKTGTTKAGKPWHLWSVKALDGRSFGTFSETLGGIARNAMELELPLRVTARKTERGLQLETAEPVEAEPEA